MQLTDQDLQEFCEIWKEEYNETLTLDEARQHACQLLELFMLVAKPPPAASAEPLLDFPPR